MCRHSEPEWIGRIEDESALGGYMSRAGNGGHDLSTCCRDLAVFGSIDFVICELEAALEHGAQDALLPPDLAWSEQSVGSQASQFGARPGAARRAVISLAGAENKIATVIGRAVRVREQFDVVDLSVIGAGNACRRQSAANLPGECSERFDLVKGEGKVMLAYQKKPVATPGDIAGDRAEAGNIHGNAGAKAIGRHIPKGDLVVWLQIDFDHADRGLDELLARPKPAKKSKRSGNADDAVAAHSQISGVIEEDDARCAGRIEGLNQQGSNENVGAARFAQDRAAVKVVFSAEQLESFRQRSRAKVRAAGDDAAGRFSGGV